MNKQLVIMWDWLRMHNTTDRRWLSKIVITRNASLVHSWALLVNYARELNTCTREYTTRERKVTSELYRNINPVICYTDVPYPSWQLQGQRKLLITDQAKLNPEYDSFKYVGGWSFHHCYHPFFINQYNSIML